MRLTQFRIDGLGHLSTLLVDEAEGVAAVVDPRRDVDVYLDAARDADVRITHVVETHLHNDYVSGGRELAALTGATPRHRRRRRTAPRASAGARRRDVRGRLDPLPDARHARAYARST